MPTPKFHHTHIAFFSLVLPAVMMLYGCNGPDVITDMRDVSYRMTDQDSSSVTFPDDFREYITVVGFIYTHCPDVCPIITANMKKVSKNLDSTSDVKFVLITFDPYRDTPSVLQNYMNMFELNSNHFTLLTGDSTTVENLLNKMDIVAMKAEGDNEENNESNYFINHTNRITLIDRKSRVRGEYRGSRVPPEHIIEDINKLR